MHFAALAFAAGLSLCAQAVFVSDGALSGAPRDSSDSAQVEAGWALSPNARHGHARLAPLPVALPKNAAWSDRRLAKELLGRDAFMALAIAIERLPARGYMDAAGANVGAGYCVSRRLKDHGARKVRADLARAGFRQDQIEALVSEAPARVEATRVSQEQGLRLLSLMKPEYQSAAVRAIGEELWGRLPENKRAALTYLSYNTGDVGQFKKLIRAARKGNEIEALRQMSVEWTDQRGRDRKNHRLRAWTQAAWASPLALSEAVSQPMLFELSFAGAQGQESFINAALTRPKKGERGGKGRPLAPKELNLAHNLSERRHEQEGLARLERMRALSEAKALRLSHAIKVARASKGHRPAEKSQMALGRKPAGSAGKA